MRTFLLGIVTVLLASLPLYARAEIAALSEGGDPAVSDPLIEMFGNKCGKTVRTEAKEEYNPGIPNLEVCPKLITGEDSEKCKAAKTACEAALTALCAGCEAPTVSENICTAKKRRSGNQTTHMCEADCKGVCGAKKPDAAAGLDSLEVLLAP
jgi:hypothetical protein